MKYNTIYEYFSNYEEEEVNKVLFTLSENDKKIIYLKYGSDLKNPVESELWNDKLYRHFASNIITRIRKRLDGQFNQYTYKRKTIYELLGDYTKEEIDKTLSNLSVEELKLIKKRYSNNETDKFTRNDYNDFYGKLLPKIKRMIENENFDNIKGKKIKSIYELLSPFTKEQIDEMLLSLNENELSILKNRYGENLLGNYSKCYNEEQYYEFYKLLLPKMRRRLELSMPIKKIKKIKTIYELLNDYSKEEIDKVICNLKDKDKELLKIRYGDDLEVPNPSFSITKAQTEYFYNALLPMIRKKLRNNNIIEETDYIKIINFIKTDNFDFMVTEYGAKESIIILLSEYFTYDKLSIIFNITKNNIITIIRNFEESYKNKTKQLNKRGAL